MSAELFELALCGGATERLYRRKRRDIEQLPWHSLDVSHASRAEVVAARREWTDAALQEYASAGHVSLTLRALLRARAPLDLSGALAQFSVEEIEHAELCARVAGALGGGTPLRYQRSQVFPPANDDASDPIVTATERVVREFCVGEAMSLALLTACQSAAQVPLMREVLDVLVEDEKRHAAFGWLFLDWAMPELDPRARHRVARAARAAIADMERFISSVAARRNIPSQLGMIGALGREGYVKCAQRALEGRVRRPLRRFALE